MESGGGPHPVTRAESEASVRSVDRVDLAGTIVGLIILAVAVGWLSWMGLWVGAVTGRCDGGVYVCDDGVIAAGVVIAMVGPLLVGLAALIVSVVRLAVRRPAWWIPPLAFLVAIGVLFGGAALAHLGVQDGPRPVWSPEEPGACRPAPEDPYRCTEYRHW